MRRITFPLFLLLACSAFAADYHVGPGQDYATIGAVPWYTVTAGDTVYIHWKSTPYREKFLISGQGTASDWIRVLGVKDGPAGEGPTISGDGATTSTNMHYRWPNATGGSAIQWNGIIQVAGLTYGTKPKYIEIANLKVQDGYSAYQFTAENGTVANYNDFCACIYTRSVEHLNIHDNELSNCGLGYYNWTGADPAVDLSIDSVIRGNYFHENGIANNYSMHHLYTEARGSIIEENYFGPLRAGAIGSAIKDRSSGTIVRYNWMEYAPGNMLDLDDAQGGGGGITGDPAYAQTFVYGNVFDARNGINNMVKCCDDTGIGNNRTGPVYFYHNTLVRPKRDGSWRLGLFANPQVLLSQFDVRNNVFWSAETEPGYTTLSIIEFTLNAGSFNFGTNWISPRWTVYRAGETYTGTTTGVENMITADVSNDAKFADWANGNLIPAAGSPLINAAGPLSPVVTDNILGLDLTPTRQISGRATTTARSAINDIGAFGYDITIPTITTPALPEGITGTTYPTVSLAAVNGTGPYTWALYSGSLPAGLSLSPGGVLSGTPTSAAAYTPVIQVTDSLGKSSTRLLVLTVMVPNLNPRILTASLPNSMAGIEYSATLAANNGTAPYTWTLSVGSLPPGLALSTAGVISGQALTSGASAFTVMVTDSLGRTGTMPLTLTVAPSNILTITSGDQVVTSGAHYSYCLSASGGTPPYVWSVSSPGTFGGYVNWEPYNCGVNNANRFWFNASNGSYTATFRVADSGSQSTAKAVTFYVGDATPPVLSIVIGSTRGRGQVGVPYTLATQPTLAATGGIKPYRWDLMAGVLPEGVTLTSAGTITGTPAESGTFTFTARVTDAAAATATRVFNLVISPARSTNGATAQTGRTRTGPRKP